MNRDAILHRVRTALGRSAQSPVAAPPALPGRVRIPVAERVARFRLALEGLGGTVEFAGSPEEARTVVKRLLAGRTAVAADHPFLTTCGIGGIAGVEKGITDREEWRRACAERAVGVTSADYALAETGSLVLMAAPNSPRLASLLPLTHIAVVPLECLLSDIWEFYALHPRALDETPSVVFVTGPSRTADIEQILVRGVHGPGHLHVVFVEEASA
jgi:L-lactate utilization protein LutC